MFFETKGDKSLDSKMERLYKEYKNAMLYAANNILRDEFLAEDAVQQSFIKRILSLLLIILVIFSSASYAFATTPVEIHNDDSHKHGNITTREVAPCAVNGIHYMYAKGWAKVYTRAGAFRMNMNAHVCKYCGETFLCTGEPAGGGAIGTYITGVDSEGNDGYVWIVYTDYGAYYSSKSTMPGYRFLYN